MARRRRRRRRRRQRFTAAAGTVIVLGVAAYFLEPWNARSGDGPGVLSGVLRPELTTDRPDRLVYRTLKITALHQVGRDADAIAYLDATEQHFKKLDSFNEQTIASLAQTCLGCMFHERSAVYYEEVIPLHQRTHRNRGVGGGTLSTYYGQLAQAYIGLGKVDRAVDAASAAVVSDERIT